MADFYFNIIVRIVVFLYALWIGGLATVIYNRIPNDIPIGPNQKPRCNNCKKEIKFKYFFPILGYFFSNGKCIHCGMKIPRVYLFLELSILFYILILSLTFDTFDEKFISKSLYGSFIITLMFIYRTNKQIKVRLIWMLVSFILAYHGYNYNLPEAVDLFISCSVAFFSLSIIKKYMKISMPDLQICVILITSLGYKIGFVYLALSILLYTINKYKNIHLSKTINIVFITLILAIVKTLFK